MTSTRKLLITLILVFVSATLAMAQAKDVTGSKDSPLVSRYPGSVIIDYIAHEFDEFNLPVGVVTSKGEPKFQVVEGKTTLIKYANPQGRSSLEIDRNYEDGLKSAGFETIFACKGDACGLSRFHLTSDHTVTWYGSGHFQYSAKVSRPQGDIYISLHVTPDETYVDMVETKPMQGGLVVAADLKSGIGRSGHVAVYGIHFDTGKAEVKPDSAGTLGEIAKLLQADPKLKLYVVGHTDNVGALAANVDLSQRRAAAVVQSLTGQYRVDASRLLAEGAGPYAPVAANDTEAGRAQNRRVELVRQ